MRPPSGAAAGYSSCPRLGWAGPVPMVKRVQGLGLVPAWLVKAYFTPRLAGSGTGPIPKEAMMRFYQQQHRFYCGIDLHARSMYLCILDQAGTILLHQNFATDPKTFLQAVAPYR